MTREELIKSIDKEKECHLAEVVHDLIRRAISEDEKVEGKYLKALTVEVKERGVPTMQYDYYVVTDCKFVRIFASESGCWFKLCPLDKFIGLEEKILTPESLEVNIHFDVTDNELRQIKFISEGTEPSDRRVPKQKNMKKFVSALTTAVSNLSRR